MYIDYLYNYPQYAAVVSKWIYNEFVVTAKGISTFEKVFAHFSNTNINRFPITFIALKDNECVGTVSIFENDLKNQEELTPWLASLYVSNNYRGQGIGAMLIEKVQKTVKNFGFKYLYLRTEHTSEYYRRLGWEFMYKTVDEKGQETEVFRYCME